MRIDRDANELINSHELLDFFRDNKEFSINESDTSNLIKYFDVDEDGRLSFQE